MMFNGEPVPDDASVADLEAMLRLPPPRCWVAMKALGRKSTLESLRVLERELRSDDAYVRRSALEAIADHTDGARLEDSLLKYFDDAAPHVIRQACATAATLGLTGAHDRVAALLDSPLEDTRAKAIATLSALWREEDFERLLSVCRSDPEDNVRKAAAWVLFEHATQDTAGCLFEAWRMDEVPRHRVWACELCAKFNLTGVDEELRRLSEDPDGHVRAAALRVILSASEGSRPSSE